MENERKTKGQLLNELTGYRKRIFELEKAELQNNLGDKNLALKNLILDSTTDSIFLHDFSGNLVYVNKTAYLSLGYTKAQLMKMSFHDLFVPGHPKLIKSRIRRLMKKGKAIFESAHFDREKSVIPVEIHAQIVEFNDDKLILSVIKDMRSLKKVETEIKKENQKLMDIIQFLADATFIVDQDRKVIAWNKAMEDLTGVPKEEVLKKRNYAYSLPLYGVRRPVLMDLILSPDKEVEALYDYVKRDKNTLYAEVFIPSVFSGKGAHLWAKARPLHDEHGKLIGAIESIRDISDWKQGGRALKEQSKFLQDLIDSIHLPIFYKDANGIYKRCNEAFQKYLGLSREEIIDRSDYDLAPRDLAQQYHKKDRELFKNPGVPQIYEAPLKCSDGTMHDVLFNKATYINTEGKLTGIIGVMFDLAERKETEEAMQRYKDQMEVKVQGSTIDLRITRDKLKQELNVHKKTEEALQQSEERYRSIIESAQSGIVSTDSTENILYVNQHMAEMLGYQVQEMLNRSVFDFIGYESQKSLLKHLERRKQGVKEVYELKFTCKDDSDLWALISSNPLFNDKSEYIGSVEIVTDISSRKNAEKALMDALVEKENYTRFFISKVIEAINELIERENVPMEQESNLT